MYAAWHHANETMNVKIEGVSDAAEEEDPLRIPVQEIKAEPEIYSNSEEVLMGPYSETYPGCRDRDQAMDMKAEEVSDAAEEEDPLPRAIQEMKAEPEKCTDSENVLVDPYGETYPACYNGNQTMNIKAEEGSDAEDEADPVQITFPEVKAEPESTLNELQPVHGEDRQYSCDECGDDIQRRWKSLRNCFTREVGKQKSCKSGAAASGRKTYVYFDQLSFLIPCVGNRCTVSSIPLAEEEQEPQQREGGREGNEEPSREQHGNTRRRRKGRQESDIMEKMYATLEQSICQRSKQDSLLQDEDRLFLLSLHHNLSSISPALKLMAKTEILQVLSKYNNPNVNAPVQLQSYSQPSSQYYIQSNIPPFLSTSVGESSHLNPSPQFLIKTKDHHPRQNTLTIIHSPSDSCDSDISSVASKT